jgi:hypothetical protein
MINKRAAVTSQTSLGTIFRKSKKAISPVVATALLLVVAVVSVVGFQGWFTEFSSSMLVDVETQSSGQSSVTVEGLIGEKLYLNSKSNVSISSIKINDIDCNINSSVNGLDNFNISDCIQNVSGAANIIVVTNSGIFGSYKYISGDSSTLSSPTYSSCSLDSITQNHGESYNFYNSSIVPFGQTCSFTSRTCNDGTYSGDTNYNYSSCIVVGQDSNPDVFNFMDQITVALNTLITSNTIVPTDYDGPLTVGITGDGSPQLSINGGSWITSGQMNLTDNLAIRLTSSASSLTSNYANLTLGNYSTIWNVTTTYVLDCSALNGGEWSLVPGDATYGTSDFCVMKYEARWNGSGTITNSGLRYCGNGNDYNVTTGCPVDGSVGLVSKATDTPLRNVNQFEAIELCKTLGSDYNLITNNEWMTITRNIEQVSSNWADGTVGSTVASGGGLKRGNVGIVDSASYNGANPESGTGRNTTALLNLSNGGGIWDLSGNLWEWTSDTIDCSGGYSPHCSNMPYDSTPASEWIELTAISDYGLLNYNLLRSINSTWNSDYGLGRLYTENGASNPNGATWNMAHSFRRGGSYSYGVDAGAFALNLYPGPSYAGSDHGLRCSYAP